MKKTTSRSPPARQEESWEAEAKLAQAAAEGDTDAQRELLRLAFPVVRRTTRHLLGRSQDLEDAVQASLVAVWSSVPHFEGRSSLAIWVTRITIRTTLRLAKKQRSLVPTEAVEGLPAAGQAGARSEAVPRSVPEYLQQLPEPQRVAVVLRYALDYSVDDIAQATETSPNTVKYRLKAALAKMRRLVRQDRALWGKRHEER